jgi:hypothetical protein
LLVRGVAAAKTGQARDKEEARFYLEWVLRSEDATSDQKASAWLWLSQIEEDPRKKRGCLENVLAWEPANIAARRGLAILDGRLKAEDIVDPNKPIEPVKPETAPQPTECPAMSAPMRRASGAAGTADKRFWYAAIAAIACTSIRPCNRAHWSAGRLTVALATARASWEYPVDAR